MSLCVPLYYFVIREVNMHNELVESAQLQKMVSNMDMVWAFHGPSNLGRNSWLLLQHNDVKNGIIILSIQSKKCTAETCMQP